MSLHDKIMNLNAGQSAAYYQQRSDWVAYKTGHRDARHAAAELAHEADDASDRASLTIIALTERVEKQGATIAQLVEALEKLKTHFPTDDDMHLAGWDQADVDEAGNAYAAALAALASTAAAGEPAGLTTCNCRWNGDEQVQQCTLHAAHVEAIHEWAERAKVAETALHAAPPAAVPCRDDGRCQYAIDHGAEGMGHCSPKCVMPHPAPAADAEPVGVLAVAGGVLEIRWLVDPLTIEPGTEFYTRPPAPKAEEARDAERYRWLRANALMGYPSGEGSSNKDAYLAVTGYGRAHSAEIVDDAIEAAMRGGEA